MTCLFCGRSDPPKAEPPEPSASGGTIYVAALSLRDGDWRGMSAAWTCDSSKQYALGYAMDRVDAQTEIVGHLTFEIPLASGIAAQSGETVEQGSTVGKSPTAKPDAHNNPIRSDS